MVGSQSPHFREVIMADKPTLLASPHTVTSASVGTALTQGAGTITAFTMN